MPTTDSTCPTCGYALIPHEVAGVSMLLCNDHGRLFAADQLEQLLAGIEAETRASDEEAQDRVATLIRERREAREREANR